MENKGYGSAGASLNRRSTKGFTASSGSPQEDIDLNNYTLRQRGRLLYMGNSVGTSAIKTHRTNTIGMGLMLNPRPDAEYLGLTPEAAARWTDTVKREFALWADGKASCDATGVNNFYELQQMLFTSMLMSGDVYALIEHRPSTWKEPYTLRIKAIEADRIATPNRGVMNPVKGKNPENGNRIFDGVEIDGTGAIVAYWICNTYPFEFTDDVINYVRVKAVGDNTGLPNILQLMVTERPEQYRGVTFLANIIIPLLQLNRYTEAELTAAIVQSFLSAFIKKDGPTDEMPYNEATPAGDEQVSYDPNDYELGPGTVNVMNPGEDVTFSNATHPQSGYNEFVDALCQQIGAALEIPAEILLKKFDASYSAARGALLEAWKAFKMYRQWFVNDFCNPIYEIWISEAVARGRISAPGFFTDPIKRKAWLKCAWVGPSQGMLDPLKEITAEAMSCEYGFSTHEDSAMRLNGSDFNTNIQRLIHEKEMLSFLSEPESNENSGKAQEDNNNAQVNKQNVRSKAELIRLCRALCCQP